MSWTKALLRLQEIDDALAANKHRLSEIASELADETALRDIEKTAEQKKAVSIEARRHQNTLEFELKKVQDKQQQTEQLLYGGTVHNSRELQDLQTELEALKRRVSQLEDDVLAAMLDREEADSATERAAAMLIHTQEMRQARQAALHKEQETLNADETTLNTERTRIEPLVPLDVLDSYTYLRKRIGHMPVATIHGGICGACGIEVSHPIQQKIRREEVAYCDGCRRLIVTDL